MTSKLLYPLLKKQIDDIEPICSKLKRAARMNSKLSIVNAIPAVKQFIKTSPALIHLLDGCDEQDEFVIKAVLAIGQGPAIFHGLDRDPSHVTLFKKLINDLKEIEQFYGPMGGIVGYHLTALKLISAKNTQEGATPAESAIAFEEPEGLDITKDTPQVRQAVRWGIERMDELAELYPLGGAGDRLHLQEEDHPLPVAQLSFCGRTLLEGLIRDLHGREYIYYKLFGNQLHTPLAIMTSHEKNNHDRIMKICKDNGWFGRPEDCFKLFIQPLVPMVTQSGFWAVHSTMQPVLKPGGHGVIWKAALDHGVFDWMETMRRTKGLVRQINNPAAGVDHGLLALTGLGCQGDKDFGFASCSRLLNMPEGMNVLSEKKLSNEYEYCISNIEYTEFEQSGIKDFPKEPGSPYSRFPANTNILFIDLQTIKRIIERYPLPGVIINMKNKVVCWGPDGDKTLQKAGRLESTMQNIADYIVDKFPRKLEKGERGDLRTFITYNERRKTLSAAKQAFEDGNPLIGTPEGCYFELLQNYHDLLANYCGFSLPHLQGERAYLSRGPSFIADFHPALGVLYRIISQKIRGGHLAEGAEWVMEIAEADISNLRLQGSLLIKADAVMGKISGKNTLVFDSANCGKCTLINVNVKNKGIDRSRDNIYWKHCISRQEALSIKLHGNAEFYAHNVTFEGEFDIEVPDGYRLTASQEGKDVVYSRDKIEESGWHWTYAFDKDNNVVLTKTIYSK